MKNPIPYPLRATRISIDIRPFGFWLIQHYRNYGDTPETAKEGGKAIWYARWAWFQISYSRWR